MPTPTPPVPARTINPKPCRWPGCNKHAKGRGLCNRDWYRARALGGDIDAPGEVLAELWRAREETRSASKVAASDRPDCEANTIYVRIAQVLGVSPDGSDDELVEAVQRRQVDLDYLDREIRSLNPYGFREGPLSAQVRLIEATLAGHPTLTAPLLDALGYVPGDGPPPDLAGAIRMAIEVLPELRERPSMVDAANWIDALSQAWGDPPAPPPSDPYARLAELVQRTRRDLPALRQRVEDLADTATVAINRPVAMTSEELVRRYRLLMQSEELVRKAHVLEKIALAGGFPAEVSDG